MFQFPGLSPAGYVLAGQVVRHNAHRVSPFGDPRVKASSSPRIIAGSRVLHRLSVPRHPLYALSNLISLDNFMLLNCLAINIVIFG